MNRERITAGHWSRLGLVYIRQSSPQQVVEHTESQRRQRNLTERAKELGWPAEQIRVVDDDLGETASRSGRRFGFEDMVAMAALGKVGIILGLDVSRLARGNRDWYHLLDICAITRTLIADEEALYDPGDYNDRLLLGLKGTMSEAELHQMKQRLVESVRSKAKRGELRRRLAPGFVWDEAGRIQKDPDQQVVAAIALVFQRFDQAGTIHQTHISLVEEGVQLPVCVGRRGLLAWRPATLQRIARILKNPTYAGAYAYGRRRTEEYLDESQRPRKRQREVGREAWHALLKGHHEGYISWEQYETNQQRIRSNWHGPAAAGAPREGVSLLQGLVQCGRCGRPMNVAYGRDCRQIRYACKKARAQTAAPICQAFGAWRLERAVESLLLECLSPLGMEAMLAAARLHAEDQAAERTRWTQKVERARYEVQLARRQYEAVDPDHRLVARELERRYEEALGELERAERETEEHLKGLRGSLSADEERRLQRFANDVAALWHAPTTRPQDRKRIARCLIESVVVTVDRESTRLKAVVHWKGGEETTVEVAKGRTGVHRYVCSDELVELIRSLAKEFSDAQIARILHRKRLRTPKDRSFHSYHVTNVRRKYGIPPGPGVPARGPDVYTAEEAGRLLEVDRGTVIRWVEIGLLKGSQATAGAPWRIVVTQADLQKLKPRELGVDWLGLKGAARRLKLSPQTVLQKVQSGELSGVRVRRGRRIGWRIHLPATTSDDQPTLF